MVEILLLLGTVGTFAFLVWFAKKSRRSGVGSRLMGVAEEIWHPNAHRTRPIVQQVQTPSVGDPTVQ